MKKEKTSAKEIVFSGNIDCVVAAVAVVVVFDDIHAMKHSEITDDIEYCLSLDRIS